MKKNTTTPPASFQRFFRWYCHPDLLDYIEGDLLEVYGRRVKKLGKRKADLKFIIDVLLLLRPGIIRSRRRQLTTPYGMYKSYFKIGWRNLLGNKAYTLINMAGLASSVVCAIFIFSFVRQHLAVDNFHPYPERTYRVVTELHRDVVAYQSNVPSPLGEHFRNDYTYAEKIARVYTESDALITLRKENELVKFKETGGIAFTEAAFFDIFHFPLLKGRPATVLTEPNTAILTERMARKLFGEKDPVGEVFWFQNRFPFTVTGVLQDLPANTDIRSEIFVSYPSLRTFDPWLSDDTDGWGGIRDGMKCYVVLKPGVPTAQVEDVLSAYVKKFRPTSKNVHHYKLQPLRDVHFNAQYGGPVAKSKLWVILIIGAFLIITACVNFINLATAQVLRRSKDVGVRKTLGSSKSQLFGQFMVETALITFAAIAFAAMLAYILFPYINAFFQTHIQIDLFSDPTLLLFMLGVGVGVTFLAGYYPAAVLAGFQPVAALKGKLLHQRRGGFNTRRTLIVAQFVIAQVLMIGMLVIMNQMRFARQSDLGFDKEAIVMVAVGRDSTRTIATTFKNEIARIPGVEKVALCYAAPSSNIDWGNSIRFENSTEEVNFRTSIKSADADYLSTFGLTLVAGRNLVPSDTVREMLINEVMVRKLGLSSAEDALGRHIAANGGRMKGAIVGVLKDFHDKSFHEEISPVLITTYTEDYSNYAVKIDLASARSVLATIEEKWLELHPDQLFEYEFLDDSIAGFYTAEETSLKLIQTFSLIAIFIGCLGLYGLVSFMIAQKTKEIGIRKVLGGTVTHITWLFGKEFIQLIVIAFLIATPIGWWGMRQWLQDYKFQVPLDAATFLWAFGGSCFVAACTIGYQVLKTAGTNPVKSLRTE
ncbi:ABC transporter permease [Parachryseolinea silvisoli]|uniref:ABC transporter permease n=1 Tax=Parachryseolinea silvisoli TaxID=2873601 RepID=UPI00226596B2|nr:ABC transporter permease [Parachryseolinea silvisoli]MCD9015593.1 ABC transporter permease [Parachryseolinea silvisoli]